MATFCRRLRVYYGPCCLDGVRVCRGQLDMIPVQPPPRLLDQPSLARGAQQVDTSMRYLPGPQYKTHVLTLYDECVRLHRPIYSECLFILAPASGARAPYQGPVHAVIRRRRTGEADLSDPGISAHRPRDAAATLSRASAVQGGVARPIVIAPRLAAPAQRHSIAPSLRRPTGDPQRLGMARQKPPGP
jgi:hypothetical protein